MQLSYQNFLSMSRLFVNIFFFFFVIDTDEFRS